MKLEGINNFMSKSDYFLMKVILPSLMFLGFCLFMMTMWYCLKSFF